MDSEVNVYRSLPPLVEGKLHGYLKLYVDEVLWARRSPGDVTILASWWGEIDSAQFRPTDVQTGLSRLDRETVETYAVRTSIGLFIEYLKNCETVELVVISEETHGVIGSAHIADLLDIFEGKNDYSRYFPIINEFGNRLGDIHVSLKFLNMTKGFKTVRKMKDFRKTQFEEQLSYPTAINMNSKYEEGDKFHKDNKSNNILANMSNSKHNDYVYKSVLKDRRMLTSIPMKKFNTEVADKLVAQVVARAQRLRGAILKETYDDDPLALSETSVFESSRSDTSADNEAKLYEYFLGKKMSRFDEHRALETLRSTSPTPSLINLASETIQSCHTHCKQHNIEKETLVSKPKEVFHDITSKDSVSIKTRESSLLDQIDSMKIIVESLTLSPAGYRRVRSSCVSRGDSVPLAVTYFVEYDTTFTPNKKIGKKFSNENRPTKLCSKKQVGQVIYFNHQAIFDVPRCYIQMEMPLKFKVFNRHLNQRTPTLLGFGSIHINEVAEMETLGTTQKLAIVDKGIKVGELRINIELGCDGIHFGRDFVDAVTSTKQNIPVYEISSVPSTTESKLKSATGTHSKPNSRVSTSSKYSFNCTGSKSSGSNQNNSTDHKQSNTDDRYVKMDQPNDNREEKVLLHGLIYIAEGKGLPKLNTYLICRAFWKEDRATSQLCSNTGNPLYHFHELVPLLHGSDLLDRTKDNFIVTEVWSRNVAGQDSLLGFAKLPLHQLYIAYRDPLVVPHLLLSKYPVISVDGWVPICEPVTGRSCGELLALVALGTADQIALLEMTRGLRGCNITPPAIQSSSRNASQNTDKSDIIPISDSRDINKRVQSSYHMPLGYINSPRQHEECSFQQFQTVENVSNSQNTKTQESQTEITTVEDTKTSNTPKSEATPSQSSVLHALVDHLAQALNVPKSGSHPVEMQTLQLKYPQITTDILERIDSDPLSNGSVSSSGSSPRENYDMPTEMYRSVGVGAEFDDTLIQVPSTSYLNSNSRVAINKELTSSNELGNILRHPNDESSFRAHVEIECALHLPMVEKNEGAIEPSTYVTFQPAHKDNVNQFGSYKATNISPNSCSPKWEWRCDTRLASDLLVNDQKRMILKIWRLSDPPINLNPDLDKDIVIGFAAVDLSVLLTGFPLVSGWFHIMDFTGRCNGQIKVTITPLENISMFIKSTTGMSVPQKQTSHLITTRCVPQNTSFIPQTFVSHVEQPSQTHSVTNADAFCPPTQLDNNSVNEIGLSLGDVSMTFLSQSLKQKLTELDEITKRLKSRLHDVTNEDFEVDFDPDFDINEPELEIERNQNGNILDEHSRNPVPQNLEDWQPSPPTTNNSSSQSSQVNERYRNSNFFNNIQNRYAPHNSNQTNTDSTEQNLTDTGYSTNSHVQSSQSLSNGHFESENQSGQIFNNGNSGDEAVDQPVRGARMHINHLLDKLTSLTSAPPLAGNFPIKRNIHDFIASLRHSNIHSNGKCNQEVNVRTVPTQTEYQDIQRSEIDFKDQTPSPINVQLNTASRNNNENNNIDCKSTINVLQDRSKVSTLIREELVLEENNDTSEFDDLTTHLLTSNVRHMDLDSIFNPLLYQHRIPDAELSNSSSNPNNSIPDLENLNTSNDRVVIEELDNRYAETFNATINNGLGRLRDLIEIDASLIGDSVSQNRMQTNVSKSFERNDFFRMAPTGISDNIDGNIDVSVADKPSNDDLMASNSTQSTTTLSFDTSSIRQRQEVVDNVSLISSDSSVSVVTRQAPDGGNPTEETTKPLVISYQNESENSSTDS